MLNGFGDKAEIEAERARIERDCKVKARYSPADLTRPAEIADMMKTAASLDSGARCNGSMKTGFAGLCQAL
jgi:hypothetical protein